MQRNRFPGKSCVLCASPSVGVGEHVWPRWLIGDFKGEGPFRTDRGGVAYETRKGEVVLFEGMPGVHVPMCEPCNSRLSSLVEDPAKPVVRKVPYSPEGSWPILTAREAADLGRWFLKVGLLLAHPNADHDSPHVTRDSSLNLRESVYRQEWVSWLADGVDPSDHFTVYVTRRDDEQPRTGDSAVILLPGHLRLDGQDVYFMTRTVGVRGLQATLVWHPGWPIRHPQVESGEAAVLWPQPRDVDLSALPPVHGSGVVFSLDGSVIDMSFAQYERVSRTPLGVGVVPAIVVGNEAVE